METREYKGDGNKEKMGLEPRRYGRWEVNSGLEGRGDQGV